MIGECDNFCQYDGDCNPHQKCCRNGCRVRSCMDAVPVPIPHIVLPRQCPEKFDPIICDIQECTDTCDDPEKICCQNECGSRVCVDGQLPPSPCSQVVANITDRGRLGQFVPECSYEDGTFSALQCWSGSCWCVDKQSGKPISDAVNFSRIDELNCLGEFLSDAIICMYVDAHFFHAGCDYNGQYYNDGERIGCAWYVFLILS